MNKKVQIIIIEKKSDIPGVLLLRTNKFRGNFWQNVTGSVEKNESFENAALREVQEETGIKDNSTTITDAELSFNFCDKNNNQIEEKVFLMALETIPPILISEEHDSYQWKRITEVTSNDFNYKSNYDAFLKAVQNIKTNYE